MSEDFPVVQNEYLQAKDFQDSPTTLVFAGWDRKANEDDPADSRKKHKQTWKDKLKYQLRYSFPKIAIDEAGEQVTDENGEPFINRYYDEKYPHGYSIIYKFDEGQLESGSLPLFKAFCRLRPTEGEKITIERTGEGKETRWTVKRFVIDVDSSPDVIDVDNDLKPDSEMPF